jgi:hypothetical protein
MRLPPTLDKWVVLLAGLALGIYGMLHSTGIDAGDWLFEVPAFALMCMAVYVAWNALCQAVVRLLRKHPSPARLRVFVNVTFLAFMMFAAIYPLTEPITVRLPKRVILHGPSEHESGLRFHFRVGLEHAAHALGCPGVGRFGLIERRHAFALLSARRTINADVA